MQSGTTLLFMLALMVGMMFFMSREPKETIPKTDGELEQASKRV